MSVSSKMSTELRPGERRALAAVFCLTPPMGAIPAFTPDRFPIAASSVPEDDHQQISRMLLLFGESLDCMPTAEAARELSRDPRAKRCLSGTAQRRGRLMLAIFHRLVWASATFMEPQSPGIESERPESLYYFTLAGALHLLLQARADLSQTAATDMLDLFARSDGDLEAFSIVSLVARIEDLARSNELTPTLQRSLAMLANKLRNDALDPRRYGGIGGELARVNGTSLGLLCRKIDALSGVPTHPNAVLATNPFKAVASMSQEEIYSFSTLDSRIAELRVRPHDNVKSGSLLVGDDAPAKQPPLNAARPMATKQTVKRRRGT